MSLAPTAAPGNTGSYPPNKMTLRHATMGRLQAGFLLLALPLSLPGLAALDNYLGILRK